MEWQKKLPKDAKLIISNYTYLDGELHVKLALCADYIIKRLRAARPSTAVAFLCTPTDIHVRTDESDAAARKNYVRRLSAQPQAGRPAPSPRLTRSGRAVCRRRARASAPSGSRCSHTC